MPEKILLEFDRAEVAILGQALTEYIESSLGTLARHVRGGNDSWDTLRVTALLTRQKLDRASHTKPVLVEKDEKTA